MAEQLSTEDFTELIDSLTSIVEKTASVYHASDHVGLEIRSRKLEEHTMLIAISLSQNSSLGDLFEVFQMSLAMLCHRGLTISLMMATMELISFWTLTIMEGFH